MRRDDETLDGLRVGALTIFCVLQLRQHYICTRSCTDVHIILFRMTFGNHHEHVSNVLLF